MAKRKRRQRADSASYQTTIMREAINGKNPPHFVKISEQERPYWDAVIAARAEWTEVDLVHAAVLATALCGTNAARESISKDGATLERIRKLEALSRLSLSYSVKIQVHALATTGNVDDVINKNKAKKAAIDALANNAGELEDGLIGRPQH